MNGPEVFRLGRRLMKLAVQATPGPGFRDLPTSVRIVLVDVHEHPDTTIGQIVTRTGFPQSHVSAAVARLRDSGALVTAADPNDRRRTIVRPARGRRHVPAHSVRPIEPVIEAALAERFSDDHRAHTAEVLAALEVLSRYLTPPADCTPGEPPC